MKKLIIVPFIVATALPAAADLTVVFDEGAPKDRFSLTNDGACTYDAMTVTIELEGSNGGLIFDITGQGAGVSVFQPLELVAGRDFLIAIPEVRDGDTAINLPVVGLAPTAQIAFTIDVDDTAGVSETMVNGSEITGAKVIVTYAGGTIDATFDGSSKVRVPLVGCNA